MGNTPDEKITKTGSVRRINRKQSQIILTETIAVFFCIERSTMTVTNIQSNKWFAN